MKRAFLLLIASLSLLPPALAQLKHDNIWTIGYSDIAPSPSGYPYGGIIMDFSVSPPSFALQDYVVDRPKATICDKSGQLIAYTDGCRILNRNHQVMLRGDTLNPGNIFNIFCKVTDYPLWQPTLFLPKPGSDSLYYLFHLRNDDWAWSPMNLMYSVVDASGDEGNGEVVSKNNSVLSDSLYLGEYVTATRHANGRDWWVVVPRRYSNNIHVSLFTAKGVEHKGAQDFDSFNLEIDSTYCCSQSAFSTDGSRYFRNGPESLLMLDFDRCTGTLSNPVRLDWDSLPPAGAGVSVSPNSRFLYLTSGGTVQQYDLWATDLAASMQVVAVYDGTLAPYPANFFQMMRGPDGKIYIITTYDNNILHVIHHPDSLGLACHVEQHAFTLPARTSFFIPNFANYNLGPLEPPCDSSVSAHAPVRTPRFEVSPNPTTGLAEVSLPQHHNGGSLAVYNVNGQKIKSLSVAPQTSKVTLDLGQNPAGFYWAVLSDDAGKVVGTAKVSVSH
ncbi:MAG: T9SS type A sorting domain-containing protein [Saprospiraceae bacterium]